MDRRLTAAFVFAATMFGWNAASAETFAPVPVLGTTVLDLDTQGGNYSGWVINDVGPINSARATLQVHRVGTDPKWAPNFSITVSSGERSAALNILKSGPDLPIFVQAIFLVGGKTQDVQPLGTLELNTPLDVAVEWAADGSVTIRVGKETRTIRLGAPVKMLSFTGSTGEVEFNPLQIGQVLP